MSVVGVMVNAAPSSLDCSELAQVLKSLEGGHHKATDKFGGLRPKAGSKLASEGLLAVVIVRMLMARFTTDRQSRAAKVIDLTWVAAVQQSESSSRIISIHSRPESIPAAACDTPW
jgi:hypothetical protein